MKMFLVCIFLFWCSSVCSEVITLWHGFDPSLSEHLKEIVERFNNQAQSQGSPFRVELSHKGYYQGVLEAILKAKSYERPDLVQVFSPGILQARHARNADGKPLFINIEKMCLHTPLHESLKKILPPLQATYRNKHGLFDAVPSNMSTTILLYNVTLLRKYDLQPPHTWEQFEKTAAKLASYGESPRLASAWPFHHHVEQLSSLHGQPFALHKDYLNKKRTSLIANPFLSQHLETLRNWYVKGWLSPAAQDEARAKFAEGTVCFLTDSPGRLSHIRTLVGHNFEIGVGFLPYWAKYGPPYSTVATSSAFWTVNKDYSPSKREAICAFLNFLISPDIQALWQQRTAYIPVTQGALELNLNNTESGFNHMDALVRQATLVACQSYKRSLQNPCENSILLEENAAIQALVDDKIKQVIVGQLTPENALESWVRECNNLITQAIQNRAENHHDY
jgi:sn-glycerol 3-phosphate transport system substrate-binding protein